MRVPIVWGVGNGPCTHPAPMLRAGEYPCSCALLGVVHTGSHWHGDQHVFVSSAQLLLVPPPPLVVPHPLSFPRGGWGTVTWSTQNFSLQLIVLLCG